MKRSERSQGTIHKPKELYDPHSAIADIQEADLGAGGFFRVGRDFENRTVTHKFSDREKEQLKTFESLEYQQPQSAVRRTLVASKPGRKMVHLWVMFCLIGLVVGVLNWLLRQTIDVLSEWHVETVHELLHSPEGGTVAAWAWFVFFGVVCTLIASSVVVFIYPASAASGVPDVLAYHNGVKMPKVFNLRNLVVKFVSCVFCVASGLPVGPEGPMIHMGAMVGRGLPLGRSRTLGMSMQKSFFSQFRNDRDQRDFVSAGAAAGVSAAFGAPIGGLLFVFEEVSSYWSQVLTWMIFLTSLTSVFVSNLLNSGFEGWIPDTAFGYFNDPGTILFEVQTRVTLHFLTLLPTILVGIIGGIMGALFTFINLKMVRFRIARINPRKWLRVAEPVILVFLYLSLSFFLPLLFQCKDVTKLPHVVEYSPYLCSEGQYNPYATLSFHTGDTAIRRLFHRGTTNEFTLASLFTYLDPGVYALIGAASFFGGVSRLTVALTVIMLEISNDLHLSLPIMAAILVSKWMADKATHSLYHALLEVKCVPFVDYDPVVKKLDCFSVSHIMSKPPVFLPVRCTLEQVRTVLTSNRHNAFPVTGPSRAGTGFVFRGSISRSTLRALLRIPSIRSTDIHTAPPSVDFEQLSNMEHVLRKSSFEDDIPSEQMEWSAFLDLSPYMNTSAVCVSEDMTISVGYTMFRSMGLRHMFVINDHHEPVGVITRKDLLGQTIEERIAVELQKGKEMQQIETRA